LSQSITDQIGTDPTPGGDALEGFVDDPDDGDALDGDADHGGDVLQEVLGVLLSGVQWINPDVDFVKRNLDIFLSGKNIVNL